MNKDIRSKIEKVIPNNPKNNGVVDKVLNIVADELTNAQFVATLQQEQWENLMHQMVKHPNDSLIDFMAYHVPSRVHEERLNKYESFESADIS